MSYKVLSDTLDKPDIDDRTYRLIELPNRLVALMIHDPTTDKSAAALDVNSGAFNDPPNLPGLAHFCEHLLFMGTTKYPSENEYGSYLSKNSGYSNAYTSSMHTNFYFEVANNALQGALDRFAQFFICPLFSASGKDREINAVDSENKKNLENDDWRLYQLMKSGTSANHPYHGFSTGNRSTLTGDGVDVREELLKYHRSHYSANLMRLVVLSNETLDNLTDWTVSRFSDVVNKDLPVPFYSNSPYQNAKFDGSQLLVAKPIKEMRSLQLVFPAPDTSPYWESHPSRYLSHLIGHESEGSLLYHFKEKKWATGLSAGPSVISSSYGEFVIGVDLTREGLNHYKEIIADIFKYCTMLQNEKPQKWVFDEMRNQSLANFRFRQKASSSATASRLASSLHGLQYYNTGLEDPIANRKGVPEIGEIPSSHFLSLSLMRKFEPNLITKYASYLNPHNFKAMLVAKEPFEKMSDVKHEKWYNTVYKTQSIDDALKSSLEEISHGAHQNKVFHLPPHNNYLPTDFSLAATPSIEPKYPKLIEADSRCKLWYRINTKLAGPRSALVFKFNLPGCTSTPLNSVLLSLFLDVLDDDLNGTSYLASLAGLSHEFDLARDGMSLRITGFSDKLEVLLDTLLGRLAQFTDPCSDLWDKDRRARFSVLREKMLKNLKNFGFTVPYNQVGPMVSGLINENSWLVDDQLEVFDGVTFEALRNYVTSLFDSCFIEVLALGNYSKADTKKIGQMAMKKFHRSIPLSCSQFTRGRSLDLPEGKVYHFLRPNDDPDNINSCLEMYMQLGHISDGPERVMAELVAQIIHEPFFDRLRTKEQLGYVVFSSLRETRTTFGLRFLVQSERSTAYLYERVQRFIIKEATKIDSMSEDEFAKHVSALVTKKMQKVKNIKEQRTRFWNRIASGFYDFDRRETDSALLKGFSLDETKKFYREKVLNPAGHGVLAVHLQSQSKPKEEDSIKRCVSNFLYEHSEFDDLDKELETVEDAKAIPGFQYGKQLQDYIDREQARDYTTVPGEHINQVGEWKCGIPLTAAPSAKILESYLDPEISKL